MILGGLVAGARHGIIYIRHEYPDQEHILAARDRPLLRATGILGANVLGSGLAFDLEVFVSPGGYICGEESALLEAIEGKRAEPRNKPPFPGQVGGGLWAEADGHQQRRDVLLRPGDPRAGRGLDEDRRARTVRPASSSSASAATCVKPGRLRSADGHDLSRADRRATPAASPPGRTLKAFAPSGPAGGYLPASMLDLPLDWNAMTQAGATVGSGAIVVCDDRACMLDMALNSVRFFRNESCGKCVPCRTGSPKLADMLDRVDAGAPRARRPRRSTRSCAHALKMTSICGLGQVVPRADRVGDEAFPRRSRGARARASAQAGVCFRIGAPRMSDESRSPSTAARSPSRRGRRSSTRRG